MRLRALHTVDLATFMCVAILSSDENDRFLSKATPCNDIKARTIFQYRQTARKICIFLLHRQTESSQQVKRQPESNLPVQITYSVLRSVFSALDTGFFGIETDLSLHQRRVPLLPGRMTFHVLCVLTKSSIWRNPFSSARDDD